ncbi:MAG: endonuclease III, partial [Gammaproteobacteria bacterium]|nr:endonuclease III [Gammaproteobacteria bacterium]
NDVERKLLRNVPALYRKDAHHWLILHGRYVCKARKPECPTCVIADLCSYKHKTPARD